MQKSFSKILITIFLLIFILQLAGAIFLLAVPSASQAGVNFTPQVGIGDDFKKGVAQEVDGSTSMIADYIKAIYKYALGIVGILATVVLMFGGVLWIIAGGNAERITNAKSWITAALTGLVLALTSYMILYIVNPGLVNFRVTPVTPVDEMEPTIVGCCQLTTSPYTCRAVSNMDDCDGEEYYPEFTCIKLTGRCTDDDGGCCVEDLSQGNPLIDNYYCTMVSSRDDCHGNYKVYYKGEACSDITTYCPAGGGGYTGGW